MKIAVKNSGYLSIVLLVALSVGCTKMNKQADTSLLNSIKPQPAMSHYTSEAAMDIYGYQPVRALQIIDSAVIVGNLSQVRGDIFRAKIYSSTLMSVQTDSLLGGPEGVSLDSAKSICEHLLTHDSIKNNVRLQYDVMENLVHTARMQDDTLGWMQRSRELIDVCHQIGEDAEADALRTEEERQHAIIARANLTILSLVILALSFFAFAIVFIVKNRSINRKNHLLAMKIADALKYKKMYLEEKRAQAPLSVPDLGTVSDEQLFQYINEVILHERLFLDPKFERQTIMDRFQLTKERVGAVFSKGSAHAKLTSYVQQLRLEYAAKLVAEQPDKNIVQIAAESGFSTSTYFSDRFRQHFGLSPTISAKTHCPRATTALLEKASIGP